RDSVAIRSQEVLELRLRHRGAPLANEVQAPLVEIEPDDVVAACGEACQHRRPNPPEPDDGNGLVPHPWPALPGSPVAQGTFEEHRDKASPTPARRKRDEVARREP